MVFLSSSTALKPGSPSTDVGGAAGVGVGCLKFFSTIILRVYSDLASIRVPSVRLLFARARDDDDDDDDESANTSTTNSFLRTLFIVIVEIDQLFEQGVSYDER